jgi:hypothetical protein
VGEIAANAAPQHATVPTLFENTEAFVDQALGEVFGAPEDVIGLYREESLLSFDVPADLAQRLSDLPRSYLAAQRTDRGLRLKVTFDRDLAKAKMVQARQLSKTAWPDVTFVSDVHPMVDWLVDKVLLQLGRQQAPVLLADVAEPVFLVQGVYCNRLGQPTVVDWMAVTHLDSQPTVTSLADAMRHAKIGPRMTNPMSALDLEPLQRLVPLAIDVARDHLATERLRWDEIVEAPIRDYRRQLQRWEQASLSTRTRAATVSAAGAARRSPRRLPSRTNSLAGWRPTANRCCGCWPSSPLRRAPNRKGRHEFRRARQPRRIPVRVLSRRSPAPRPEEEGRRPAHPLGRAGEDRNRDPTTRDPRPAP